MSSAAVRGSTHEPETSRDAVETPVEYPGIPTTCDGAEAVVHVETLPALFFYSLSYFAASRLLFYFALILRGKLEQSERLLILRYECISFGATIIATACVVGTVTCWLATNDWL